jgi:hypothetical protein
MWQKIVRLLLGLAAVAPLGCAQASGDQTAQVRYPFVLTPEEIALARELAENDLPVDALPSGPRAVFIKVDLLPDKQAETSGRLVMVHHYRYQTDQTIFTMIDLHTHEILNREIVAHYPTGLAPAEVEHAIRLARADDRLRSLLEAIPTNFDARPIQYAAAHEPLFGHRVVHLLLRQDGNYLISPRVLVDLTTDRVFLE